jgi:hypothetical protein
MAYNPNNPNGQATSANSAPVVISSDQSTIPVSVSGVATAANQTTQNTKLDQLHTDLISALPAGSNTIGNVNVLGGNATAVKVDGSAVTQPVSGSVTANAGTNLNTSALALESGGNLATIAGRTPALGQAAAASSSPVALANEQVQDLYITGQGSQTTLNNNIILATAGSSSTDTLSGTGVSYRSFSVQVVASAGISAGAIVFEGSNDNTNFINVTAYNESQTASAFITGAQTLTASTAIVYTGRLNYRYFRCRISTAVSGGTVQAFTRLSTADLPPRVVGTVMTSNGTNVAVKAASTAAVATDPALVVAISPNNTPTVQIGNTANTTAILANPLTPAVTTTGDTGAKTATGNGATQTNATSKGAAILFNVGTVSGTSPTCVFKIQGSSDSGTTWYDIPGATTASLTATGAYGIMIYPGIAAVAGTTTTGTTATVSCALPRSWRAVWTIGGTTPSFTITNVQVSYLI